MIKFKNNLNIAIYFDQKLTHGGGFQQSLNTIKQFDTIDSHIYSITIFTTFFDNVNILKNLNFNVVYINLNLFDKLSRFMRKKIRNGYILHFFTKIFGLNPIERILLDNKIDLVYFITPSFVALELEKLCFIFTVWDLSHRDDPEFPEVRIDRIFENREILLKKVLPKSISIIVDSNLGKLNLVKRYGIDEERVYIIPFTPAQNSNIIYDEYTRNYIDIKGKYNINFDYIYYPAQFWAHKNHIYIIEGIYKLEKVYNYKIGAIFSGNDKGNLSFLKSIVNKYELSERIKFIGFVDNEEIPYLYKQSLALVMPTYFGPTNLPPLEAFNLGVPVLYSNLPGLNTQVGNAALLLNLEEVDSLVENLKIIINDEHIRNELILNGKIIINTLLKYEYKNIYETILKKYSTRRNTYGQI